MSKFKVGDRVTIEGDGMGIITEIRSTCVYKEPSLSGDYLSIKLEKGYDKYKAVKIVYLFDWEVLICYKNKVFQVGDRVSFNWGSDPIKKGIIRKIYQDGLSYGISLDNGTNIQSNFNFIKKLKKAKTMLKVGDKISIMFDGIKRKGIIDVIEKDSIVLKLTDKLDHNLCLVVRGYMNYKIRKFKKTELKVGDRVRIKSLEKLNKGKIVNIAPINIGSRGHELSYEIKRDCGTTYFTSNRDDLVRLVSPKEFKEKLKKLNEQDFKKAADDIRLCRMGISNCDGQGCEKKHVELLIKENAHLKSCIEECGEDMAKLAEVNTAQEKLLRSWEEKFSALFKNYDNLIDKNQITKKENEELRLKISEHTIQKDQLERKLWVAKKKLAQSKPTLDLTKPVQTRDGRKARIVSMNRSIKSIGSNGEPLIDSMVAIITTRNGLECSATYQSNGRFDVVESKHDLINVPEE